MQVIEISFDSKKYKISCENGKEVDVIQAVGYLEEKFNETKEKVGKNADKFLILLFNMIQMKTDFDLMLKRNEELSQKLSEELKNNIDCNEYKELYFRVQDEVNSINPKLTDMISKFQKNNEKIHNILEKVTEKIT